MTRIYLGAFGDPGHAFPAIALGRALAARGHDVTLETWTRWREHVERDVCVTIVVDHVSHGLA